MLPYDNQIANSKKELLNNLLKKGIKDYRILSAIANINREDFIDKEFYERAYDDNALPIKDGQTISQPFTVAFMLELLDFQSGHKVLEIGTGSGYLTALLLNLGMNVYTIERSKVLYETAKRRLEINNLYCKMKLGDGTEGWKEFAPYDRVIVSAASPDFPDYLSDQLNDDSIVICPVGDLNSQTMMKGVYRNSKFEVTNHSSFKFVPLIGKNAWNA